MDGIGLSLIGPGLVNGCQAFDTNWQSNGHMLYVDGDTCALEQNILNGRNISGKYIDSTSRGKNIYTSTSFHKNAYLARSALIRVTRMKNNIWQVLQVTSDQYI